MGAIPDTAHRPPVILGAGPSRMRPTPLIAASNARTAIVFSGPLLLRRLTRVDHVVRGPWGIILTHKTPTRNSPAILIACLQIFDRRFSCPVTQQRRPQFGDIRTTKMRIILTVFDARRS